MNCLIKVHDLCEIVLRGEQMNTRIVGINENSVHVFRSKSNERFTIIWDGTNWRLEDDTIIDSAKFMKSVKSRTKFPFVELPEHAQYNVLVNSTPNEFLQMCSMSDFSNICTDEPHLVTRLYKEKLERDIRPDILKVGYELSEGDSTITWNEFYRYVVAAQNLIQTSSDPFSISIAMDKLIIENSMFTFKLLSKMNFRPSLKGLDLLAQRHRYRILNYLRDEGLLDWVRSDPHLNNFRYLQSYLATGR